MKRLWKLWNQFWYWWHERRAKYYGILHKQYGYEDLQEKEKHHTEEGKRHTNRLAKT